MGNISIKMSTQIKHSLFKFEQVSIFDDSEQNYMSVSLKPYTFNQSTKVKYPYRLGKFMINDDANTSFLTDITSKINAAMPNKSIQLMSPVYFYNNKPSDHQRSVT